MKRRFHLYSPGRYKKVNPKNKDLLADYQLELEFQGRSPATVRAYSSDIHQFFCWLLLYMNNVYILKCRKRVFRRFFLTMIKASESHARINRVGSSIRNMLEYAADDDDVYKDYNANVMAKIKGLDRQPTRTIYFMTDAEVTKMIHYLVRRREYELATFVSVAYDSGGRRGELRQISKKPFLTPGAKETNVVTGKENKSFRLLFWERSRSLAKLYLDQRGDDDVDAMWITRNGAKKPVSDQELYYWVRYLRRVLYRVSGKRMAINVHSFRHAALNNYHNQSHWVFKKHPELKGQVSLNLIKTIAHHANAQTTLGYFKDDDKEQLKNVFKL